MFHTLPYGDAMARGRAQNEILEQLTETATNLDQVDFEEADRLILASEQLKYPVREQ